MLIFFSATLYFALRSMVEKLLFQAKCQSTCQSAALDEVWLSSWNLPSKSHTQFHKRSPSAWRVTWWVKCAALVAITMKTLKMIWRRPMGKPPKMYLWLWAPGALATSRSGKQFKSTLKQFFRIGERTSCHIQCCDGGICSVHVPLRQPSVKCSLKTFRKFVFSAVLIALHPTLHMKQLLQCAL